ncbi:MAG: heavy-metal-associated domain-containing protein [Lachnospiraceae bacterium]|nr:heavy-metal-associated domain-containing protein [Lachnospiraceae bacterium]
MVANIFIIVILVVFLIFALRGSVKHFNGGCCGGGDSVAKEPDKKLSGKIIMTKVYKIDGMYCENCTNSVKRAINRIDGVSAKLNFGKKQAVVQYEKEIDDEMLIKEIESLGYNVVSISVM